MKKSNTSQFERIQRVGRLLWGFSWFWLILNVLALLLVTATVIVIGISKKAGFGEEILDIFGPRNLVIPSVGSDMMRKIAEWDYQHYLDHFWLTLFYILGAFCFFVVTMIFILKIASAWKKGDVFGDSPIRSFRILGWIHLIHGFISIVWGIAGQLIGSTQTADVIYFSFLRDVCFMSFSTSSNGIEWGLLALALSWILKHAQDMREEQRLIV